MQRRTFAATVLACMSYLLPWTRIGVAKDRTPTPMTFHSFAGIVFDSMRSGKSRFVDNVRCAGDVVDVAELESKNVQRLFPSNNSLKFEFLNQEGGGFACKKKLKLSHLYCSFMMSDNGLVGDCDGLEIENFEAKSGFRKDDHDAGVNLLRGLTAEAAESIGKSFRDFFGSRGCVFFRLPILPPGLGVECFNLSGMENSVRVVASYPHSPDGSERVVSVDCLVGFDGDDRVDTRDG